MNKPLTAAVLALLAAPGLAVAQTTPAEDTSDKSGSPAAAANGAAGPEAAPASDFTVTGSAAVVSQYRFRGISQSDNKPVIQGTFTLAHKSGLYVSVWGSSAEANDAVNIGGTEIDVYGGYTHALGASGVTVDAGVYGYIYPGSEKAIGASESYVELYGSLARAFGPVTAKAGVNWAPNQHYFRRFGTPTRYDIYAYGELGYSVPGAPISLHGHVGHTGGGFDYAGHDYVDYALGAGYKWRAFTLDLSLVGTDLSRSDVRDADLAAGTTDYRRASKPVAVVSLTAGF